MDWLWIALWIGVGILALLVTGWLAFYYHIKWNFLEKILRIFQEKPLFIVPRGKPVEDAEEVDVTTADGLKLAGCYLKSTAPHRQGVILFGLEFGSNRWACVEYCQFLRDAGFDIFAVEFRNQGDSDSLPNYEPLQWITDYEVLDMQGAISYLKSRPDVHPNGIGFFGISKGAGAGVIAGATDPFVRCFATDGMFATYTTMVPYMQRWIAIYSTRIKVQRIIPTWYYAMFARIGLKIIQKERQCHFHHLEPYLPKLAPRPLLMIHGKSDNYIKPEMAQALFDKAGDPKEYWLVEKAKHNQSLLIAAEEYKRRVLSFFETHLGDNPDSEDSNGNREFAPGERQATATVAKV